MSQLKVIIGSKIPQYTEGFQWWFYPIPLAAIRKVFCISMNLWVVRSASFKTVWFAVSQKSRNYLNIRPAPSSPTSTLTRKHFHNFQHRILWILPKMKFFNYNGRIALRVLNGKGRKMEVKIVWQSASAEYC